VPRLVSHLPRKGELHVHVVGRHQPAGGDLGRFDLVLERDLQEIHDGELTLDFGCECGVRRQTL
jgi:hypothetical protein